VDADANFLTVDGDYRSCVEELMEDLFYDIDDVTVEELEVEND